jgi:hypothetical protein
MYDSYSGGPEFETRPRNRIFCCFPQSRQEDVNSTLKLINYGFLPHFPYVSSPRNICSEKGKLNIPGISQ